MVYQACSGCLSTTRGKETERIGVPTVGSQACHLKLEGGQEACGLRKKLILPLPILKESALRWLERGRPLGTVWSLVCREAFSKASSIVSSQFCLGGCWCLCSLYEILDLASLQPLKSPSMCCPPFQGWCFHYLLVMWWWLKTSWNTPYLPEKRGCKQGK